MRAKCVFKHTALELPTSALVATACLFNEESDTWFALPVTVNVARVICGSRTSLQKRRHVRTGHTAKNQDRNIPDHQTWSKSTNRNLPTPLRKSMAAA
jgi:hypothetical protein